MLVVGGGIIGAATAAACRLARLGSVLLIERGHLAAGATSGSAGMLVPESHVGVDPAWLVELMRTSLGLWRELEARRSGGVGFLDLSWIVLEPAASELPTGLQNARRVGAAELQALIPTLAQPQGAVVVERQGRVNPVRAVLRLLADIDVATEVTALSVATDGGRITRVGTSAGDIQPGLVIFATGVPPQLDDLNLDIPYGLVKGHLVATEPAPLRLPGYVLSLATQIDDGRLLVGSSTDPGDDTTAVRADAVDGLWTSFVQQLADASGLSLRKSHQWCCFRPWHPDSIPVLDRVPGVSNAWFSSGQYKTGVLMAPVTAQLLVDWIRSGSPPEAVAPMSASRLMPLG